MNEAKNVKVAELKDRLREAMALRNKKAVDLSSNLGIPKSAISQYLSGRSKDMDSPRLYKICVYLDVSEAWMMGFDVPMKRPEKDHIDSAEHAALGARILKDTELMDMVKMYLKLDEKNKRAVRQMVEALSAD